MPAMIDAVFDIQGDRLPDTYPFALWEELVCHIPQLAEDTSVGVVPLRTSGHEREVLLSRRSKLALRLPRALTDFVADLVGAQLDIAGHALRLGAMKLREIQPYPTVHAHLVASADEEVIFVREVGERLAQMGIAGKWICGRHGSLVGADRTIYGYSLVIHNLKTDDSLKLQYAGLGPDRRYGCGVFVPYKDITGLD